MLELLLRDFFNHFVVLELMQLKIYVMIMNVVVISFRTKLFQITVGVTIN